MTPRLIYEEDILKNGFESRVILLRDDYQGSARSVIIRRLCPEKSKKAVLYIHGFNDYFFQSGMAEEFNRNGYNFYALDLRRYGRSLEQGDKPYTVTDIRSYFEEINAAISIMTSEGNETIILNGHSTGGLILTLFAKDNAVKECFDALILNSPFFRFNLNWMQRNMMPAGALIGKFFPRLKVKSRFNTRYGKSLHKDYSGEWDYDLRLKPNDVPKVELGWIRAIYSAQKELKKKFYILQPVLVMYSACSISSPSDMNSLQSADAVLNIQDIKKIASNMIGDVETVAFEDGMHDLLLSRKSVRKKVYETIFEWLKVRYL